MVMDSQVLKCRNCGSMEFEYDEDTCRNVCLKCNAMEEMTGIGVATLEMDTGINYKGLQKTTKPNKRKHSSKKELRNHIKKMKPFKLEDMFHWLFELQIEAMRPFVTDFEEFKICANCLWQKYLKSSGSGFDVKSTTIDDLRLKKYPLGWGVPLDPNRVEDTLNIVPRAYYKLRREESTDESDGEIIKHRKNAKKIKIEKMVKGKFDEKPIEVKKMNDEDMDDSGDDLVKVEERVTKVEVKEEIFGALSDSDESKLSDEDDPTYINFYNFEGKEKNIVRLMRKKKDCQVRYFGGHIRTEQLFMENNLLLLFYALHFTKLGTNDCCCLLDILRLAKRGDIPFLKVGRFLPVQQFFLQHTVFQSMILRDKMPNFNDMKHYALYLAETLNFEMLIRPEVDSLIKRNLREQNLPSDLIKLINFIRVNVEKKIDKFYDIKKGSRLIEMRSRWARFKMHMQHILFPEQTCLAYIFISLRIIMRFDSQFEIKVSLLAKELEKNGGGSDKEDRLFVWTDWLQQQHRPPTVATANTWKDFDQVRRATAFFDGEENEGLKYEDTLEHNDLVNSCGRFVQPYKKGTHDNVMADILTPLLEALKATKATIIGPPKHETDFTGSCIDYLVAPAQFQLRMEKSLSPDSDSQCKGRPVLDRLVQMVTEAPLTWRQLALNHRRYPKGVFEELLSDGRMTTAENCLLDVLVYNTGLSYDALYSTVDSVTKLMSKK